MPSRRTWSTSTLPLLLLSCGEAPVGSPKPGTGATLPTLEQRPLRERPPVAGPRFRKLDPAASGLRFTNELRRENTVGYVYIGSGVAVGDYDQDGLQDVFLVSLDGPNRLFRQTEPLRFVDVTATAGGLDGGDAWGTAASFVDVDGDRDLDLYVGNLESPNQLWLNQGDGTFREGAAGRGLDVVAATSGVSFADYDNDGDLDLFVLTNRVIGATVPPEIVADVRLPKAMQKTLAQLFPPYPTFARPDGSLAVPPGYEDFFAVLGGRVFVAGQRDRLLRNDGGRFVEVGEAAGIRDQGNGLSSLWWDHDLDGDLDLYVANDLHSPDHLYENRGDGTFVDVIRQALPHTVFFGMGSDFGDVDGDGRFDLLVADMSSTSHYMGKLLMGNMNTHRWFLENADPQQYMRNALYLNTGTGRFLEAAYLHGVASTDWTWTVRFADLDEDGLLDLFATNGIPVFTDDPDAGRRFTELFQGGQKQQALEVYRHLRRIEEKNIARRNTGDAKFEDVGPAWGLDESSVGMGAVVADLDGDGDQDIVVNNQNQPASVFENCSTEGHRVTVQLDGGNANSQAIGARVTLVAGGRTQVRQVMPTRGYMSAGPAIEHFGLGAATKIDSLTVRWTDGTEQTFRELAADQQLRIRRHGTGPAATPAAAPAPAPVTPFRGAELAAARHRERAYDDFAVQPLLPHKVSMAGPGLAVGDVDGDGRDDLWLAGAAGQAGSMWRSRGDGTFAALDGPWANDAASEDLGALFVDVDQDGDLDLLVASGGVESPAGDAAQRDRVYRNDGKGGFTAAADVLPDDRTSTSCLAAADFDRDGDLDLFAGGQVVPGRFPEAPPSRLLRNDGGRFVDASADLAPQLAAAGMVHGATWSDLDGDGFVDLVVAAAWQPLRVHRNDGGKRLVDATEALGLQALTGQWHGVLAADLDGDGDQDLVATNLGQNAKYKASDKDPLTLFAKDFDGNGSFDVVEGKQQAGTALPVRGLSCSSEAMPFLNKKFPTYDAFAKATLPQIYGEDLGKSLVLTVAELRHHVFENQGSHFVPRPLPRLAQIAPGFGIAAVDLDADGRLELVLAHNSFAPEPETGRMDGGLGVVLHNRGGLQFTPLGPRDSGYAVVGDAKALVVGDFDGDARPDLLTSRNDGPLALHLGQAVMPGLAVRLRGAPGNPHGCGAQLTLTTPDGVRHVREIAAGSGYLGQGAAIAWFPPAPSGSSLVVRWPDGRRSETAVTTATGALVVTP